MVCALGALACPCGSAFDAVDHPLEHTHVFAVAGPDEFTVVALAEPVHAVNARQRVAASFELVFHVQPVLEIVAHVVAAKRQHGERVAAHHAHLADGGGGGLGAHGGGHVDAFHPVTGLGDQWHGSGAAATEDEGINRHAFGVVPLRVECRIIDGSHREARVRMSRLGAGFFCNPGRPVLALPVDQMGRQVAAVFFHAFPPHVTVIGQGDVGENHVFVQAGHAVGVGMEVGARCHAKVTGFRVDGVHSAVGVRLDPGDVVADGGDAPAIKTGGRHQHREIGLAASTGESGRHVVFFARFTRLRG